MAHFYKKKPFVESLFLVFTTLISCQNLDKRVEKKEDPRPPQGYTPAESWLITQEGENWDGHFSPDGLKILFLSRNRPRHRHSQVYELDRTTLRQRRMTFHDGENSGPRYDATGKWILYASTTDEIKENPIYIQQALRKRGGETKAVDNRLPQSLEAPYEIYRSSSNGDSIKRLTHTPKYDAEASYHPKQPAILFTSVRHGKSHLYLMNLNGSSPRLLSDKRFIETEGQFHPGGKELVFVRYTPDRKQAQIILKSFKTKKEVNLTQGPSLNQSPVWMSDGDHVLFSSNRDDLHNFEIYLVKKDGSCLQRLTYKWGNERQPAISPDGKTILFTSDRSGTRQLYLMDFKPPTTCPEASS